ncbi:UNVERIFIED_ORG: hypothetical protein GGD51_000619 [Rhizobium esperanzae]
MFRVAPEVHRFFAHDQDRAEPHGIFCRQHSHPGSSTFLPRNPALLCFVVDERQGGRSPSAAGLQRAAQLDVRSSRAPPAPARQCAGGWRLLVCGMHTRTIRDDDQGRRPGHRFGGAALP